MHYFTTNVVSSTFSSTVDAESLARKVRRRKVVTACFLLSLPGSMLHFGNILPYLLSYYHFHKPEAYMEPLWVVTAFQIFRYLGLMVSTVAESRVGLVRTVALGGAVVCVSMLLCVWSIKEPVALFITFGVFYGLGAGTMFPMIAKTSLLHVEGMTTWMDALLAAGLPTGAFLYMIVAYLVINPFNASADLNVGYKMLFSDSDLISNVPFYFLAVAVITLVPVGAGLGLLYFNTKDGNRRKNYDGEFSDMEEMVLYAAQEDKAQGKKKKKTAAQYGAVKHDNNGGEEKPNDAPAPEVTEKTSMVDKGREYWLDYTAPAESTAAESLTAAEEQPEQDSKNKTEDTESRKIGNEEQVTSVLLAETDSALDRDLHPKDVLKTRDFWVLWVCAVLLGHTQYIQENLYKLYGETKISNDAVFTLAGLLGMVTIAFTRPLLWTACGRWGGQIVCLSACAAATVLMTLMYVFHRFAPPLYIVTLIVQFGAVSAVYLLHTEVPLRLFGSTHAAANALLVWTAPVVVSVLDPIIAHQAIVTDSWGWLMASGSITAALALFGLLLLPNMRKPQQ